MPTRVEYFAAILAVFFVSLIVIAVRSFARARKASSGEWDDLLGRLQEVDRGSIELIALDLIGEGSSPAEGYGGCELDASQISRMIGGLEGLQVLKQNCDVLIDLACYVQRWYPEAMLVAEELRLNAREIQWHISRLEGAARTQNLETNFADYAQRAVAAYYLMTQKVLALYASADLPGLVELQRAI